MNHEPIRVYSFRYSGHCHRVLWLISLLGLKHEVIEVNLKAGEQKKPDFLAMNPFGQVPVIQDGAQTIGDSTAILFYLANKFAPQRWTPKSPVEWAELQRWLAVAAGVLAFGPAQARAIKVFGRPDNLELAQQRSHALFAVIESHLANQKFLLGNDISLADLANYAYVARAPEGGVSLDAYPNIKSWLNRLEASPGFVVMPAFPTH